MAKVPRARDLEPLRKLRGFRGPWQIRWRWLMAPLILGGAGVARLLGFSFELLPFAVIAAAIPLYNLYFLWLYRRSSPRFLAELGLDRRLASLEVVADYTAMFALVHATGGAGSPLVVFLLPHIVIASIHFRAATAYQLAGLAVAGVWGLWAAELLGWLPRMALRYQGQELHALDRPVETALALAAFTTLAFVTAAMMSRLMAFLRLQVGELATASQELRRLNDRLGGLYSMVAAIGRERRLEPILHVVTHELARVMDVPAVAIKLLSDDRRTLRYVAACGLPGEMVRDTVILLEKSPINRRVIDGETMVHTGIESEDAFQLRQELRDLGFQSALLAPLPAEGRVIGTISCYSTASAHFRAEETHFLRRAAELVAVAIEDARANEAIEQLMADRTEFMLRVAHNLRAPLGASLGMLELLREGYVGELADGQREQLARIEERLRGLDGTIGELLSIARARDWSREIPDVVVEVAELADYTERVFADDAVRKEVRLEVRREGELPAMDSGARLLEQLLDNLVSNAIKYTPAGGEVEVRFVRSAPDAVQIVVRDTGIGIPEGEQEKLFTEFFRASNARRATSAGTGLGLVLARQTVERHKGRLTLESAEGRGTTVVVDLPIHRDRVAEPGPRDGEVARTPAS